MRYLGVSVCVLFCALLIKDKHRVIAFALSVSGICIILYMALSGIKSITAEVSKIASAVPSAAEYIRLMLKVLAITLLSQLVSDLCRDNGEAALAGTVETAAKAVVIALVLPLFRTVITIVSGLIK